MPPSARRGPRACGRTPGRCARGTGGVRGVRAALGGAPAARPRPRATVHLLDILTTSQLPSVCSICRRMHTWAWHATMRLGGWASRWRMHEHLSYVSASYRYVLPIAMCILSAYNRYGKKVLATVEQRHPSNAPAANRKLIISASVGIASMKKQQICN